MNRVYPVGQSEVPIITKPFQEDPRYNLVPDWRAANAQKESNFREVACLDLVKHPQGSRGLECDWID